MAYNSCTADYFWVASSNYFANALNKIAVTKKNIEHTCIFIFFLYFVRHYSQQRSAVRSTARNTKKNKKKTDDLLVAFKKPEVTISFIQTCVKTQKKKKNTEHTRMYILFLDFPRHYSQRKAAVRSTALKPKIPHEKLSGMYNNYR